jgi:hypothetical protein
MERVFEEEREREREKEALIEPAQLSVVVVTPFEAE